MIILTLRAKCEASHFDYEQTKEVNIARIMYKGRDIRKQLGNDE